MWSSRKSEARHNRLRALRARERETETETERKRERERGIPHVVFEGEVDVRRAQEHRERFIVALVSESFLHLGAIC
jgi:hypothetical protein